MPAVQAQTRLVVLAEAGEAGQSYWIGVECAPVDEALRVQLSLDKGQGLVILEIMPESPAAKAGLKPFDVLVKADGKSLGAVADLAGGVAKSQDKELKLELIRAGKAETVTVKPGKRPSALGQRLTVIPERDREAIDKWIKQLKPGENPGRPMAMQFFHPGMVLPTDVKLPEGTSVKIVGQGDEPAKITVEQNDKKWEVTEDKLGELPENVRNYVARLLPRVRMWAPGGGAITNVQPLNPAKPGASASGGIVVGPQSGANASHLERQLQQLHEKMEGLLEKVDRLEKKAAGDNKSGKK